MAMLVLSTCLPKRKKEQIPVSFKPSPSERGHQVWRGTVNFQKKETLRKRFVIIGGGISGLSAAWHLDKAGHKDLLIIELDDRAGGNSVSGANQHSEYPYGAHYLTLPNPDNAPLISFLHDKGIIREFDATGNPVFNETDLCLDPEERLFIRGVFQEGLIPSYGLDADAKKEMDRFFALIKDYRDRKGEDGKYIFNMPRRLCSDDPVLDDLDKVTFSQYLKQNDFTDAYLLWYLDYCCRDDFGGDSTRVSAWAGINYFAAHRAQPSNTDAARVLTWPEGNGRLVKLLVADVKQNLRTGLLASRIELADEQIKVSCVDFKNECHLEVTCDYCIAALPPFVLSHMLNKPIEWPFDVARSLRHVPWMVAAVTLRSMPENNGTPLSWDNVSFRAESLGYIFNQHQELRQLRDKTVLSLYLPLDKVESGQARKEAVERQPEEWRDLVLKELTQMHPGIETEVEHIEICLWGHGMILPEPGLSKGHILKQLSAPVKNRLFFAHSDLAAYSTFEEAFDQGYSVVQQLKEVLS